MVWTGSGAVGVVDRCLRRMLSIRGRNPVVGQLRNLGGGPRRDRARGDDGVAGTAATGLVDRLHLNATLVGVAVPLLLLIVIALICASMFRVLAGERVSWRAALAGGGVSGVDPADHADPRRLLHALGCRQHSGEGVPGSRALITCYIVAIGLLLGTAMVARVAVQLGHAPNVRIPGGPGGFSSSRSSDRDPQQRRGAAEPAPRERPDAHRLSMNSAPKMGDAAGARTATRRLRGSPVGRSSAADACISRKIAHPCG